MSGHIVIQFGLRSVRLRDRAWRKSSKEGRWLNALGKHLLLELKGCDKEVLNDIGFLREALLAAAGEARATVLGESFHKFNPHGVSGVVMIAESHLVIHTWPEYGYAAADIFTCGDSVQPEKAAEMLVGKLGSKSHSIIEMQRGILDTKGGLS